MKIICLLGNTDVNRPAVFSYMFSGAKERWRKRLREDFLQVRFFPAVIKSKARN